MRLSRASESAPEPRKTQKTSFFLVFDFQVLPIISFCSSRHLQSDWIHCSSIWTSLCFFFLCCSPLTHRLICHSHVKLARKRTKTKSKQNSLSPVSIQCQHAIDLRNTFSWPSHRQLSGNSSQLVTICQHPNHQLNSTQLNSSHQLVNQLDSKLHSNNHPNQTKTVGHHSRLHNSMYLNARQTSPTSSTRLSLSMCHQVQCRSQPTSQNSCKQPKSASRILHRTKLDTSRPDLSRCPAIHAYSHPLPHPRQSHSVASTSVEWATLLDATLPSLLS